MKEILKVKNKHVKIALKEFKKQNKVRRITCSLCGTYFSYQFEDIINDCGRSVACPNCRMENKIHRR